MALPGSNQRPWQRRAGIVLAILVLLTLGVWVGVHFVRGRRPMARIRALVDHGHPGAAIPAIEDFTRAHPHRQADTLFLEGYVAAGQGHWTRAARLYEQAIDTNPGEYRGNPTILRQLLPKLTDADCLARTAAAETLGKLGSRTVVAPLHAALALERTRPKVPHAKQLCHFTEAAHAALARLAGRHPG